MFHDVTKSRIVQWLGIIAVLLLFAGAYWYFRSQAAQTITTSSTNDRPDFEAPLTNDLNLTAGIGSPTFTRSDGADRRATVTDFEGLIKPVKSGEARFEGARRVENLLSDSERLDYNQTWSWYQVLGSSVVANNSVAPDGTTTAETVSLGTDPDSRLQSRINSTTVGRTYVYSLWLRAPTATTVKMVVTDEVSPYLKTSVTVSVTTVWKRFSATRTVMDAAATSELIVLGGTGSATVVYAWGAQVEEVTGQANKNPSEYISTGVKTATPYHGANVDGVKYFATQNGNTVASNVVTEATGTAIPDATLHGYLAEGTRTNLALRSEEFDNASWLKFYSTTTSNTATAPNGQLAAEKLIEDGSTAAHYIVGTATTPVDTQYTLSLYLKSAERTRAEVRQQTATGAIFLIVDLSAGTITSSGIAFGSVWTFISATIVPVQGGWYRVMLTGQSTEINIKPAVFMRDSGASSTYTGDGSSGLYLWGAQLEQASFASSYIPTTTTSVARGGDLLTYPASGNILTSAGTIYVEHMPTGSAVDYGGIINVYANGINDGLDMIRTTSTGATRVNIRSGGTLMADTQVGTATLRTLSRNAFSWATNAINVYKDGAVGTPDTSATTPTALGTNINIGDRPSNPIPLWGTARNVKIWKQVMSGTFLQNLTAGQSGVIKQTTNKTVSNTGLVGYWSFEDGRGTQATDFSGNGNTGTLSGTYTWGDGRAGKAYSKTTGSITVNNSTSIDLNTTMSLSFWVKDNGTSAAWGVLMSKINTGVAGYTILRYNTTQDIYIRVDTSAGTNQIPGIGTMTSMLDGNWHHAVFILDDGVAKAYKDGVLVSTASYNKGTGFSASAENLYVGYSFIGSLDEVRLYNRALTQDEITKLYQVTATKINYNQNDKLTNGLIGLWSFNGPDVSGTTAYDRSGSGNNGTLTNGPTVTPGKVGQALNFDGVNDYVTMGDPGSGNLDFGTSNFSLSLWVKSADTTNTEGLISKGENNFTIAGFDLLKRHGAYYKGVYVRLSDGNIAHTDGQIIPSSDLTSTLWDGDWHHIATTIDRAGSGIIYVDGVNRGSTSLATFPGSVSATDTFLVGAGRQDNTTITLQFSGSIDEVRVYSRALSADEVASLYNAGR